MNGECCAHSRVTYQPREHPDGGWSSRWLCVDCSLEFVPKVAADSFVVKAGDVPLDALDSRKGEKVGYDPNMKPWRPLRLTPEQPQKDAAVKVLAPDPLVTAGRAIYKAMVLADLRDDDAAKVAVVDVEPERWPAPPKPAYELAAEQALRAAVLDMTGVHEASRGRPVLSGRAIYELGTARLLRPVADEISEEVRIELRRLMTDGPLPQPDPGPLGMGEITPEKKP